METKNKAQIQRFLKAMRRFLVLMSFVVALSVLQLVSSPHSDPTWLHPVLTGFGVTSFAVAVIMYRNLNRKWGKPDHPID